MKGLPGVKLQNQSDNRDIGVILAFTGKKMFYFNKKSELPQKNSKTSRDTY
jgi:hypothetical protein